MKILRKTIAMAADQHTHQRKYNTFEPCREKTNIPVSDLVRHKPGCTAT